MIFSLGIAINYMARPVRRGYLLSVVCLAVAATSGSALAGDEGVWFSGTRYPTLSDVHGSDAWRSQGGRCATDLRMGQLTPAQSMQSRRLLRDVADCTLSLTRIDPEYNPLVGSTFVIPVYFHVIYNTAGTGNVSQARIDAQMAVLNEDFAGVGGPDTSIRFELAGVTRTANSTWFVTDDEDLYKPTLAVDTSRFLNIYTKDFVDNTLGYAYLPQGTAGSTIDGVVMLHNTIGGRDNGFGSFNQGRTLVHEIGHYLGLFHTFNGVGGACANDYDDGDFLVDTAPHGGPDYGCSASTPCGVNSPIENFMNYSDDRCMDTFTAEQANRMICSLTGYRPDAFRIEGGAQEEEDFEGGLPLWLLLEAIKQASEGG